MAGIVHLLKLCVGTDSVEDLLDWQSAQPSPFATGERRHTTRMWPRREAEVLAGGSLYWVIKGLVLCRQRIIRLDKVEGADGILRCGLILDPEVIRTAPLPKRPFQGWRYLDPKDAPPDLPAGREAEPDLPRSLLSALSEIGLR